MTVNATLNLHEPIIDETFATQLKDVFSSEKGKPSRKVMQFIFGFAAAYESIGSEFLGAVDVMRN